MTDPILRRLGAGMVGGTLGKGWATAGHRVLFGVRDPAAYKVQALLREAGPLRLMRR